MKNKYQSIIKYSLSILLIFVLIFFNSCIPFFSAKKTSVSESSKVPELIAGKNKNYVIVHLDKDELRLLSNIQYDKEKQLLLAKSKEVPSNLLKYSNKVKNKNTGSYKSRNSDEIDQLHIYIDEYQLDSNQIKIPFSSIKKIETYRPSIGATVVSFVASATIITTGALTAYLIIACSCPDVYDESQSPETFIGNLYPGAVYPNLERTDYLKVGDKPISEGSYRFTFANNKNDDLYTNSLELMVIEHPKDIMVLPDQNGEIQTISDPKLAISANNSSSTNYLSALENRDNKFYSFDYIDENEVLGNIVLSFDNKAHEQKAKLILNLRNSMWSAYVYEEICNNLGTKYTDWQQKQIKRTGQEIINGSIGQGVQMQVWLKTKNGWEYQTYINTVGSIVNRDVAIPLNLSEVEGDHVEVMLKAGFMFWDLDYAAIDFTENIDVKIECIKPISAYDSLGTDYLPSLLKNDDIYMRHSKIKERTTIEFPSTNVNENSDYTLFLKGSGYYLRKNTYNNAPNYTELLKIRKKGGFSVYSKSLFDNLVNSFNISQQ